MSTPPADALPAYSYAFQPIIDAVGRQVYSVEALVRGAAGEPAWSVLQQVPPQLKYRFDQDSREVAIALAARLGLSHHLNLNFLPQGLYASPTAISSTLEAARRHGIPAERLVLEVTEEEVIDDQAHFADQIQQYRSLGLKVAIDDFGAGYSGLNLLAEFQPDQVKIDMKLARGIERHGPRQAIVRAIAQVCGDLGIDVIVEGVESLEEYRWFRDQGIYLFQGYLFARPLFQGFPEVRYP
ncbi:EAL domain-containing protein [Azohydromonas australica]|uniref:EAL domain-containing protein n=1 Tax=Azohydromonas australica TaxID=364039 RepID=UPI00048BAD94|nr:EAL domain-containing protein [Azohydromonas australica]